ncbi:MAG: zinc finger domain-containing protein [Candidatus Diapherotrites archaeon]
MREPLKDIYLFNTPKEGGLLKVCSTCNKEVTDKYVEFKCPGCMKKKIIRCGHCRQTSKEYACGDCGFKGP